MGSEFEIKMSPLCQAITVDENTVQVDIYRGETKLWILEVVDTFGNSTVWEDEFPTDAAALAEAKSAIQQEGIESFIGEPN